MRIYGDSISGNCLKVKWVADYLGRKYEWIETDILRGESRTAQFLALNPVGQVPLVVLGDGRPLAQSNAIIVHLAEGSDLIPSDAYDRARMLEWMFWEQYSHEPYIAVARFICGWTPLDSPRRAGLPVLRQCGHAALAVMERHLATHAWFTGDAYGIADIALYAYTCVAPHGGIRLDAYPALRDWLARVEATPGFVPLPAPDAAAQALIDQST